MRNTRLLARAEAAALYLRHRTALSHFQPLWAIARPIYSFTLGLTARSGLERRINGTDVVRVTPAHRDVPTTYEPSVWHSLMDEVRTGDTVVDVGAYLGLYTVALAKRVGPTGRVVAFEPDPESFRSLQDHVRLNGVTATTELVHAAVGEIDGMLALAHSHGSETRVATGDDPEATATLTVRLDTILSALHVDILKVDVEGFEASVLRGARKILQSAAPPRAIYIEVHPYAYQEYGTSPTDVPNILSATGYAVTDLAGQPVSEVHTYGEIVARTRQAGAP